MLLALFVFLDTFDCGLSGRPSQARLQLKYADLIQSGRVIPLILNAGDLHSIILDEDGRKLFAATKDYLISTNLHRINSTLKKLHWPANHDRIEECKMAGKDPELDCANFLRVLHFYNQTHLYLCGTGAFHPRCTFINTEVFYKDDILKVEHTECGKGKCPYDPRQQIATAMIDRELYAGISSDFMSRDTAFFRSLGNRHVIRTEQYDSKWFQDPKFVKVQAITESENEEDDKVYLFFTERAQEVDGSGGKVIYSRVARVCKNDIGGQRSLVNKWSTFLKARLVCSIRGSDGIETHFDELQDIFVLNGKDKKNPYIYGIFTAASNILNASAVCVYRMEDIIAAFKGHFAHKEGPDYKWLPYTGRIPFPRPGTCPSHTYGNFRSTHEYPDDVIFFSRTHPLMFEQIYPINRRPMLFRVGVDYKFTRLVVDKVEAVDGHHSVMFIGTDTGKLLKSITLEKSSQNVEEIILEELELFLDKSKVTAMAMSRKRHWLYVGSKHGVAQVSLHHCELYGKACAECCLARDPYCTWNGTSCSHYVPVARRRNARQVTLSGDPLAQCPSQEPAKPGEVEEKVIYVAEGNGTFLECLPKSHHATVTWTHETNETKREQQKVSPGDHIILIDQGLIIQRAESKHAGMYYCQVEEHGFHWTLVKIRLSVINQKQISNLQSASHGVEGSLKSASLLPYKQSHQPWYKDIMTLIRSPSKADYYCEQVWQHELKKKKKKLHFDANSHSEILRADEKAKMLQPVRKNKSKVQVKALRSPRSV